MRSYEVACVFRGEDEIYGRGKEVVKTELAGLGGTVVSEDDMGQRSLAYALGKETRGHFHVFHVSIDPDKARLIENNLKLKTEILKTMVVVKDS